MERTEPSFIPGWLKGTAGGGGLATHNNSDEGAFSRTKVSQQLLAVGSNLDSPRKSVSSSKSFSSASRRNHNNNNTTTNNNNNNNNNNNKGSLDRQASERDHFGLVRSKSGLNRNSSNRNHSKLNLEQNGYNSWIDGDEADNDFYTRKKDWLSGMVLDGRDKDKEFGDSAMRQLYSAGLPGKFDVNVKLKRSQSMGLSASGKVMEVVSATPSANGNSATNVQKTVFEHNFPTLGIDDKQGSPRSNIGSVSISSPRPSMANSHLVWQGNSRSDLSRASSPGLTGGFTNPISTVPASISAGSDFWSSALADVPSSNGNAQVNTTAANAAPVASCSQTSASLVGPATPLNMAEALTQNPPRVRTPPQSSLESQRLEEFALRQSRQLIPMTPSLPKTMSLVDKTKSKSSRTADGSSSLKLQLNSSQKLVTSSKVDTSKSSQGKLLVLKSIKDGILVPSTSKSDGSVLPQVATQGNVGFHAVSTGSTTPGQRKQDRRGTVVTDGLRTKDSTLLPDDKRTALHAQNRSDFFNALRKKAAGNVSNSSTCEAKTNSLTPRAIEGAHVDSNSEQKENGVCDDLHFSQSSFKTQSNGDVAISSGNGSTKEGFVEDLSVAESKEENRHSPSAGDLEAEEAAFMRSLGWEENEEGSELTEEEINAFYQSLQMREKKTLLKKGNHNFRAEHVVGSVESLSSGLSSSDSETEEASSFVLRRAVSNSTDYERR